MPLPPEALYPSKEALFKAIQAWAKLYRYAFTIGKSKKREDGRIKIYYSCDCCKLALARESRICNIVSRGIGCPFQY